MAHDPISHVASWLVRFVPDLSGEKFGPCLLLLPQGEANFPDFAPWEVAAWDGEAWWISR